jgi:hypothetical protein
LQAARSVVVTSRLQTALRSESHEKMAAWNFVTAAAREGSR